MNKLTKDLMLEAGYAAPHIATRAQKLVELVVQECCMIIRDSTTPIVVENLMHRFRVNDEVLTE